jgi:hypothetical protein
MDNPPEKYSLFQNLPPVRRDDPPPPSEGAGDEHAEQPAGGGLERYSLPTPMPPTFLQAGQHDTPPPIQMAGERRQEENPEKYSSPPTPVPVPPPMIPPPLTSLQRAAGGNPGGREQVEDDPPTLGAAPMITPVSAIMREPKPRSPLIWVVSAGILGIVIAGLLFSHAITINLPIAHPTATAIGGGNGTSTTGTATSGGSTGGNLLATQTITKNYLFSCAAPAMCNRRGITLTLNTIAVDQSRQTMLWTFTVELRDPAHCIGVSIAEVRLQDAHGANYNATNQEQSSDFELTQWQQVQRRMQFLFVPPSGATYTLFVHLNFACGTVPDASGNDFTVAPFTIENGQGG